jgi:AcrR family transcriptional regulator
MNHIDEDITRIIVASKDLFLRLGTRAVSMDDVARAVGVSKKTLYKHFADKNQLIETTMQFHLQNNCNKVLEEYRQCADAIHEFIAMSLQVKQDLENINIVMFNDLQKFHPKAWNMLNEHHENFIYNYVRENMLRGIREGLYREGIEIDMIAQLYIRILLNIIIGTAPLRELSIARNYEVFVDYHLRALLSFDGYKRYQEITNTLNKPI